MRKYYVYVLASESRALYIGITSDLRRRLVEHKMGLLHGHTAKYRIKTLMYFESFGDVTAAIAREKQLKRWPRVRKARLIEASNPDWRDLSIDLLADAAPRTR